MKNSIHKGLIFSSVLLLTAPIVLTPSVFADQKIIKFSEETAPDPVDPGQPDPSDPGQPDPVDPGQPDPSDPGQPDPVDPGQPDPVDPGQPDPVNPVNPTTPSHSTTISNKNKDKSSSDDKDDSSSSAEDDSKKGDEKKLKKANDELEKERARYQRDIDEFDNNQSSDAARVLISDIKEISSLIKKASASYEKSSNDIDKQINKNRLLTYVNLAAQIYYTHDSPNQAVKQAHTALQISFAAALLKTEIIDQIRSVEQKYKIDPQDSILVELGIEDEIKSSDLGTIQSNESNLVILLINLIAAGAIVGYIVYSNRIEE